MSVSCEILRAEWNIPYPVGCNVASIPGMLRPLTFVNHEFDSFPWHLSGRLMHLLNKPVATFDYLHFTTYSLARAAMLILKGNVMNHKELHGALIKHRLQIGGIYRKHLLDCIQQALSIQNLGQLPECDIHPLKTLHDPKQAEKNREFILCVIRAGEINYMNTLNYISEDPAMHEKIAGESVGFWIKEKPRQEAVDVHVRVSRHSGGYEVTPCSAEARQHYQAGREAVKYFVRLQEELPLTDKTGFSRKPVGGEHLTSASGTPAFVSAADMTADLVSSEGRPQAKVVGDFNAVILPSGRKMLLTKKHKRRAFLRAVHQWCTKHQKDSFFWQEILEDYNAQFKTPQQRCMQIMSDRIADDLFKGQKAEFDELFEMLDRTAGHMRLKLKFLIGKMGCWGFWWLIVDSLCDFAIDAAAMIA